MCYNNTHFQYSFSSAQWATLHYLEATKKKKNCPTSSASVPRLSFLLGGGGGVPFKIWRAGSTEKIKVKAYSNDEVK